MDESEALDWFLKERMVRSVTETLRAAEVAGFSKGDAAASFMLVVVGMSAMWAVAHVVSREMFLEMATVAYDRAAASVPSMQGSGLVN